MIEGIQVDVATEQRPEKPRRPKRSNRLQVSLSTLLLLMAVVAVGIAYRNTKREADALRAQIPGLLNLSRRLQIDDPSKLASIARLPEWYEETAWDVYVPNGQGFELCLAMEEIDGRGTVPPIRRHRIEPGRWKIEMIYDTQPEVSVLRLLVNDQVVIEETKPKDWEPRRGSSGGAAASNQQGDVNGRLELFRRRFMVANPDGKSHSTPKVPSQGILIWIEPSSSSGPPSEPTDSAPSISGVDELSRKRELCPARC